MRSRLRGARVVDGIALREGAGVDAEKDQLAQNGSDQSLNARAHEFALSVADRDINGSRRVDGADALGRRDVERAREIVDDGVDEVLHALVLEGGAADDRDDLVGDGGAAEGGLEHLGSEIGFFLEEHGADLVIDVADGVDQVVVAPCRRSSAARRRRGRGSRRWSRACRCRCRSTAFWLMTSIWPLRLSSAPIGMRMGQALARSFLRMSSTTWSKLAPVRSILLTNAMRGTSYFLAWRQTVSDCGWTPATPQNTAIAPSSTRSERSTSAVKSTCPGVSMMLTRCSMPSNALIDALLRELFPHGGDGRGGDGDAALVLLLHPVGRWPRRRGPRRSVDHAGVKQDALGQRRLAGVDVRGDADVAGALQRILAIGAVADWPT